MEEIKEKENIVSSEQPNNDIDSLQQQIALLQQQLKQKVEMKKVTLNKQLDELITKKVELTTQLITIQQKIDNIKKELGINDVNDSDKKVKTRKAKTTDGNTVKQYYSVNGKGKYTASQIAKEYGFYECYFEKDSTGKVTKKLYANWDRFLPLIIKGKTGQGYGELENGGDRISSTVCDKVRLEVKPITTDNANSNTQNNATDNATTDNNTTQQ